MHCTLVDIGSCGPVVPCTGRQRADTAAPVGRAAPATQQLAFVIGRKAAVQSHGAARERELLQSQAASIWVLKWHAELALLHAGKRSATENQLR